MPTYQYACTECGHGFEQFQSFSDDALTECPTCGGRLRKVFNSVGIVFKGSGFYRNDSRDAAAKAKDAKPKDGKTTKESVGAGKSETSGSSEKSGSGKSEAAKSDTSSGAKSSGTSGKSSSSSSGSTTGSAA